MAVRTPMKKGSKIVMPNKGQYIIEEQIGEGGLSLIYLAKTAGNGYPVIIKEFFPATGAYRATQNRTAPDGTAIQRGLICPEKGFEHRFVKCRNAFQQEGRLGSLARSHNFQIISFADCGDGYAIIPRWSQDTCTFTQLVSHWQSHPPAVTDPVFTDLGRVRFSLIAIGSMLSAMEMLHSNDILHLDLNPNNVVWCGADLSTGQNGATFLTDFGCSVLMADGSFPTEYVLSYSADYAAPEYSQSDGCLGPSTDIYATGRLLMFLCFGRRAFGHSSLSDCLGRLRIPQAIRKELTQLIAKATHNDMIQRYQSAEQMQDAVQMLLAQIPLEAFNPDVSKDFNLYYLKEMLSDSLTPHYTWAHELRDRRSVDLSLPDYVHKGISDKKFQSDLEFLEFILPGVIFRKLANKLRQEADIGHGVTAIMTGNYDKTWKTELRKMLEAHGCWQFLHIADTLLTTPALFRKLDNLLFQLLGEQGQALSRKYKLCGVREQPHIGLAILIVYALLGPTEFHILVPENTPGKLFRQ